MLDDFMDMLLMLYEDEDYSDWMVSGNAQGGRY